MHLVWDTMVVSCYMLSLNEANKSLFIWRILLIMILFCFSLIIVFSGIWSNFCHWLCTHDKHRLVCFSVSFVHFLKGWILLCGWVYVPIINLDIFLFVYVLIVDSKYPFWHNEDCLGTHCQFKFISFGTRRTIK